MFVDFFFSKKSKRNLDIAFLWHYIPAVKYKNKRVKKLYNCSKCQQYIAYISNAVCIFFSLWRLIGFIQELTLAILIQLSNRHTKVKGKKNVKKFFSNLTTPSNKKETIFD